MRLRTIRDYSTKANFQPERSKFFGRHFESAILNFVFILSNNGVSVVSNTFGHIFSTYLSVYL